tara:strand:+ start:3707 stop:5146 length:1440 start_codon:yes stop_codon:yes gene_type:complete
MSVKLGIKELKFELSGNTMMSYSRRMAENTEVIRELRRKSGTGSDRFRDASRRFLGVLESRQDIPDALKESIDIRALAIALKTSSASEIRLDERLFSKVDSLRERPSSLFVEAVFSHYLEKYDGLVDLPAVEAWLRKAKSIRKELDFNTTQILSGEGPRWLAESSHEQQVDFDVRVERVGLGNYLSGRFMAAAKNIYYLETLRQLEPKEKHAVLKEVQKPEVFESRYTGSSLLGHEILKILITRASAQEISEQWMNVIMAIAGDPRVSKNNPRYSKWWGQLTELIPKVCGWLSKLDLKLFLRALKDFSEQPGNDELKRMYPSRKKFLEGLLKQELVTGTRLFLTSEAEHYVKRHYKAEHLPSYSNVDGGSSKPLIYVSLGARHVIEGTHSCKFWVYEALSESAPVFNYNKTRFTYRELTIGMDEQMWRDQAKGSYAAITHSGQWQVKAAMALKDVGVDIDASRLLTKDDYQTYKYSGYL